MFLWKWLVMACALVFAPAAQSVSYAPPPLPARIETYAQASRDVGATPGALIVLQSGVLVYEGYWGAADRSSGRPLDAQTLFDLGSVTKQFTAATVLRLVEEGALRLDDRLVRFFPDIPEDKMDITVEQLLTHSSGLSDETGGFEGRDADPYLSEDAFLAPLWASPLNRQPGSGYEYSNAGYSVLAIIVERVSGEPFEAALRRLVLMPAGLQSTGYRLMDWSYAQAAHGYDDRQIAPDRADQGLFYLERWRDEPVSYRLLGNGGLYSTPQDMVRWMEALSGGEVLGPDMLARLYQPLMPLDDPYPPTFTHYSYGWGVGARPSGEAWISHAGSNGLFFTSVQYGPRSDTLIVHMTNAARGRVGGMGYEVARMMDDPTYAPRPAHGGAVPLVSRFMTGRSVEEADALPAYLEAHLGELPAPWVLNRVGLYQLEAGQSDWGLALLTLNAALYPEDGNLQDSLASGYEITGHPELARQHYQRALDLGRSHDTCHWCANARAGLERLN
ncbi:serine hydrolase domain-containing protein [Oceanicaulis sp. LC35]|uniref:serine hydrolase domain-containing protein n=1 Tax=Oceanicaulis sp. LC35 TaxID=3349635 RepID=UPI003F846105